MCATKTTKSNKMGYKGLMKEIQEFRLRWNKFVSKYIPPDKYQSTSVAIRNFVNETVWPAEYFRQLDNFQLFDKRTFLAIQKYVTDNRKREPSPFLDGEVDLKTAEFYNGLATIESKLGNIIGAAYCYEIAETFYPGTVFNTDNKQYNNVHLTEINDINEDVKDIENNDNKEELAKDNDDHNDNSENMDLSTKFQIFLSQNRRLFEKQNKNIDSTHISVLPAEIISNIVNLVVTNDPDLQSLSRLTVVSKMFYICGNDERLDRIACERIWTIFLGTLKSTNYLTWRQMYFERPRIHFNGIYCSYVNLGDNIVERHRQIIFYPDGGCARIVSGRVGFRLTIGHYLLLGDTVVIFMKRFTTHRCVYHEATFIYEYKISQTYNGHFNKLEFQNFMMVHVIANDTVMTGKFRSPDIPIFFPNLIFKENKW